MKSKPLISIVITTYERDTYLEKTIESVIQEVNGNPLVEIIILDNASSNSNIGRLACLYGVDSFVKNSTNLGLFGNWNKAFSVSKGEYVFIMGDDDVMFAGFINECLLAIDANPHIDIVYTDYQAIDKDGFDCASSMPAPFGLITKNGAIEFALNNGFGLPTISMLYKRSLFSNSGFDENNFGSNDWFFLYLDMPWKYAIGIDKKLIGYRKHGGGASDTRSDICNISIFVLLWRIRNGRVFFGPNIIKQMSGAISSYNKLCESKSEQDNKYVSEFRQLITEDHVVKFYMLFFIPVLKGFIGKVRGIIDRTL